MTIKETLEAKVRTVHVRVKHSYSVPQIESQDMLQEQGSIVGHITLLYLVLQIVCQC